MNFHRRWKGDDGIMRKRTRVTDTAEYVTNEKWKWAGHIILFVCCWLLNVAATVPDE